MFNCEYLAIYNQTNICQMSPDLLCNWIENLNHQTSLTILYIVYIISILSSLSILKNFQIKLFFFDSLHCLLDSSSHPSIDNIKILVRIGNYLIYEINTTTKKTLLKIISLLIKLIITFVVTSNFFPIL